MRGLRIIEVLTGDFPNHDGSFYLPLGLSGLSLKPSNDWIGKKAILLAVNYKGRYEIPNYRVFFSLSPTGQAFYVFSEKEIRTIDAIKEIAVAFSLADKDEMELKLYEILRSNEISIQLRKALAKQLVNNCPFSSAMLQKLLVIYQDTAIELELRLYIDQLLTRDYPAEYAQSSSRLTFLLNTSNDATLPLNFRMLANQQLRLIIKPE